ncbi:hypothetical protein D6R50_10790 [Aeromonas veronii]|uniref:Fimbrial protein n=1 Tax=Aeromonas veronii TaxID=654 RepID=A0A3A9J3W1_AERVE|nr:hypothetical protein [Aeromonas veronii]RKJ89717.1 hypothetical protein D6R50_10790 [Aeromonas veronii]
MLQKMLAITALAISTACAGARDPYVLDTITVINNTYPTYIADDAVSRGRMARHTSTGYYGNFNWYAKLRNYVLTTSGIPAGATIVAKPGEGVGAANGWLYGDVLTSLVVHGHGTPMAGVQMYPNEAPKSHDGGQGYIGNAVNTESNYQLRIMAARKIEVVGDFDSPTSFNVRATLRGEVGSHMSYVPWGGGITWGKEELTLELLYNRNRETVSLFAEPNNVACGNIVGSESRDCNNGFRLTRGAGQAPKPGRLSFSVAPNAMTGNPTVAKMGGAGTVQILVDGVPVPLDGTTWVGDATRMPTFLPRITGTGAEMGEKSLNIIAKYILD